MVYVILSLGTFFTVVFLHILWCRLNKAPGLRTLSYYVLSACGFLGLIFWNFMFTQEHPLSLWTIPLKISTWILYLFLILLYLAFYYGIIINSPSQTILQLLKKHGSLDYLSLYQYFEKSYFIESRLEALVNSRCVKFDGKNYFLKAIGTKIGSILELYQKLIGRAMGG